MEKKELLEYFIDRDISELYGDFSDDGDGELELTDCGGEVAELIMEITDKAREEGYEKGVKDGLKGKVFKKVHLTEEYRPFKNRGELEEFLKNTVTNWDEIFKVTEEAEGLV